MLQVSEKQVCGCYYNCIDLTNSLDVNQGVLCGFKKKAVKHLASSEDNVKLAIKAVFCDLTNLLVITCKK